ncbi:16S rRNA (guanine(966)-N(2))-methyltransferase RsmD [Parasphingopyxis algicola]|uniref:16S rRNA (guanine(966)-N(2))-methyltransferase RsmD n=1 Tax=Parasphingopyxis algicola TaxID=2026624 RepID=UPI0015A176A7|nr:16S rRNA (guanine(966)-N(2))-methyltransferase RsmD [Parasphingopyxis algicola]QLC24057.1 16S rRNA (guanine(966)-N(2))-methyltransferase RsmD [Parasphingopyxis algicola]
MRIVAGRWRGRKIDAPPGNSTRPTTDRVREALFSMLASRLGSFEGLRVADLFAGSGALGLEALSRGAAHCTFVERDRAASQILKANIAALDAPAEILTRAAENLPAANRPYDLIFMDPPYGKGLAGTLLPQLRDRGWIAAGSWISIETERGAAIADTGLELDTVKSFGKAQISLFRGQSVV